MPRAPHLALIAVPLLVAVATVRDAGAAPCGLAQLCPSAAGPCTPDKLTCDSPVLIDLGGRALVIPAGKGITVSKGDGEGMLNLTGAASVTVQGNIQAQGDNDSGQVIIVAAGPVTLAAGSTIDVSATLDGGYIELEAESGDVQAGGLLKASAGRDGEGGEVFLTARAGAVSVGGDGINASASGEFSGGGSIGLTASATVSLLGPIDVTGGDAGELDVDTDGSIVTTAAGEVNASAKAAGGLGGSFTFLAGVDVQLAGEITATAPGNQDDGGGLGGDVLIVADAGNVEIDDQLDLRGSGPDGEGGSLDVTATLDVTITGAVLAGIPGRGFGGSITSSAGGRTTLASTLDVRADDEGGLVNVATDDTLTVQGTLRADATGAQGTGGRNSLRGCSVQVVHGAIISATGVGTPPDASNLLQASGQMTISGTLTAGNQNLLQYRDTLPVMGSGAMITPKEEVAQNTTLPCCGDACTPPSTTTTTAPGATSTTSTSTPTSTTGSSTSAPPTTVTSTTSIGTPTSTTGSSTSAPPTTTVPPTTSTTVAGPPLDTTTTSSTTSTTSPAPPTTLAPRSCLDEQPVGFDAVDCTLELLSDAVGAQSPDALGGQKLARTLTSRVGQAQQLVSRARSKRKPVPTLRRAKKLIRGFATLARRGQKRRKIAAELGTELVGMADRVSASIDVLRTSVRAPGPP